MFPSYVDHYGANVIGYTLNKWYLDDGSIVAPLPAIPSLLHSISSLSQQVGLRLNLSKCVLLHGPGITSIPPGLQSLQLRDWSDNGTKVLGTPYPSIIDRKI